MEKVPRIPKEKLLVYVVDGWSSMIVIGNRNPITPIQSINEPAKNVNFFRLYNTPLKKTLCI